LYSLFFNCSTTDIFYSFVSGKTQRNQSTNISLQTGQYCHGIAFHDCTLSFVCLIWQRFIAPWPFGHCLEREFSECGLFKCDNVMQKE
jgi:hypothetical protein